MSRVVQKIHTVSAQQNVELARLANIGEFTLRVGGLDVLVRVRLDSTQTGPNGVIMCWAVEAV